MQRDSPNPTGDPGHTLAAELRTLLDASPDAVLLVDRAGVIVALNRRAEDLFATTAERLLGRPVEVLVPQRLRAAHASARAGYAVGPTFRAMSARTGLLGLREDGAEFPAEVSLMPVPGSSEGLVMAVVRDVGSRVGLDSDIGREGRATEALDAIADAVFITDAAGNLDLLNRSAEELTGQRLASVRGQRLEAVLPLTSESSGEPLPSPVAACLASGAPSGPCEAVLPARPGHEGRALDVSATPIRDASGVLTGAALVVRDVTHARRIARELAHQATHDALTGLVNRSEFERRLARALAGASGARVEHAVCFLDLDGFKRVNDSCGHSAGDEMLRQVSGLMRDRMRARDTLARVGGDEFGLLLEHCGLPKAARIAEDIRKAIAAYHFTFGESTYSVGASIGIVPIRGGGRQAEILRAADSACYFAKRAGGNRIHVHDPRHPGPGARRDHQWLRNVLRTADDRFQLHAQPLISLDGQDGRVPRLELLLRLHGREGELISPDSFLPAARRYGLMPSVDAWVIRRTVVELSEWRRTHPGITPPVVAINLADETVAGGGVDAVVQTALAGTGVTPSALCFEIAESAIVADPVGTAGVVRGLHDAGCQATVEHCGTGMAAFTLLRGLRLDYLKIAGHIVRSLPRDPVSRALATALNQVGHALGLRTIGAEAEDREAIAALREVGVDFAQGFGVGRPEPLADAIERLGGPAGCPAGHGALVNPAPAQVGDPP